MLAPPFSFIDRAHSTCSLLLLWGLSACSSTPAAENNAPTAGAPSTAAAGTPVTSNASATSTSATGTSATGASITTSTITGSASTNASMASGGAITTGATVDSTTGGATTGDTSSGGAANDGATATSTTTASTGGGSATTPVGRHGQLKVVGNQLSDASGAPVTLRGQGFGWDNWWPQYYDASVVSWLRQDWCVDIVRPAMGIEPEGAYLENPAASKSRMQAVVDAAIAEEIYVI